MKKGLFILFLLVQCVTILAQFEVEGGNGTPLLVKEGNKSEVYLLYGLQDAAISYTATTSGNHQWYKYNDTPANAVSIACSQSDNTSTITDVQDGWGYYVVDPGSAIDQRHIWIIDYSLYLPRLEGLFVEEEDNKCTKVNLVAMIDAIPLHYVDPFGNKAIIERTYHVYYNTMKWDEENQELYETEADVVWIGETEEKQVDAPFTNTSFTLVQDDFAKHFGKESSVKTAEYEAIALIVHVTEESDKVYGDNEMQEEGQTSVESGPVNMTFYSHTNEDVVGMYLWTVGIQDESGEFRTISIGRDKTLTFTFVEEGTYQVTLAVTGWDMSCVNDNYEYTVSIGETEITIPNVFMPGNSTGTNDIFKIKYRSISNYKCSIYNRWGNLLYHSTDPSSGWDGRANGRFVATGAYYYVIEYTNSKGKHQTKSGAINILRERDNNSNR